MTSSAVVTWEAIYDDGREVREKDGALYAHLDRNALREMRLVSPGEILACIWASYGRTGWNMVYRRRTMMGSSGGRETWFLLGFMPMGPFVAIQPERLEILKTEKLQPGAGPLGMVSPVGTELWNPSHQADARLAHQRIVLPSGYVLGN